MGISQVRMLVLTVSYGGFLKHVYVFWSDEGVPSCDIFVCTLVYI